VNRPRTYDQEPTGKHVRDHRFPVRPDKSPVGLQALLGKLPRTSTGRDEHTVRPKAPLSSIRIDADIKTIALLDARSPADDINPVLSHQEGNPPGKAVGGLTGSANHLFKINDRRSGGHTELRSHTHRPHNLSDRRDIASGP